MLVSLGSRASVTFAGFHRIWSDLCHVVEGQFRATRQRAEKFELGTNSFVTFLSDLTLSFQVLKESSG